MSQLNNIITENSGSQPKGSEVPLQPIHNTTYHIKMHIVKVFFHVIDL